MTDVSLVRLRSIKQEFLDLFRTTFGYDMSPELWEWKYVRNPFVVDDPEIVVALDRGKVVGARPFLVAEMWANDRKLKVAQPCDTMVHPEYRRQGLFSRMNELAIQFLGSKGYALFYNFPSPMARPGYLRQGWRLISSVENLFHVTNPRNVISCRLGSKFLGIGLGFMYSLFLGTRKRDVSQSKMGFQVRVSDHFNDELEEVDSLRGSSAIELVRSKPYLRWRFDQHPEHQYEYIMAKDRDELLGYAVISTQRQPDNLVYDMIMDYVVKEKSIDCFRELMSRSLQEFQDSKSDLISSWHLSHDELRAELIERYGFKSSLGFPYRRLLEQRYFVVREVDRQAIGAFDIYDERNWRVSRAYLDVT